MGLPPNTFRFPFQFDKDVHPQVQMAVRYAYSGILDLQNAIGALNSKVQAIPVAATSATSTTSSGSGSTPGTAGGVNDQSGNTSYIVQSSDFGGIIIVDTPSAFALDLNNAVSTPFYTVVENLGTGLLTATPDPTGTVNDDVSAQLISEQSGLFFFDGVNWWMTTLPSYLLGGSTGAHKVVLDSGPLLTNPFLHGTIAVDSGSNVLFDSGAVATNATLRGVTSMLDLRSFPNNAAALLGGLVHGNLYRSGGDPDIICVVD